MLQNKPFKQFFKKEGTERHWEVVAAARDLAKYFHENNENGRIDKPDRVYQEKLKRSSKALEAQSPKERQATTRYIQRQIVSGRLEAGTLYYVERRFMKVTKIFRSAYQALSEKERTEHKISPAVSPVNGQKLLKVLDKKSSDPQILPIFMKFNDLLSSLGWNKKNKPIEHPQQKPDQKSHQKLSKSEKKKNLIDKKMDPEIAELGLPRNIAKKLSKNFNSLEELKNVSDDAISALPGIGKKTLKQIRSTL